MVIPLLFQWMGLKKNRSGDENEDLQSILDSSNVKALTEKQGHTLLSMGRRYVKGRPGWHFQGI